MAGTPNSRAGVAGALLPVALVAALAAFTLAAPATSAQAVEVGVGDSGALIGALADADTTVIELTGSFVVTDTTLLVPRTVTLDLNGFTLTTKNVTLTGGIELTVQDTSALPGRLLADASTVAGLAGITTSGATLIIERGTVDARGGQFGAGIGGDDGRSATGDVGNGGNTVIRGGTISATGRTPNGYGAGIGGGREGDGGTITIDGGAVQATGGIGSAGIGGGSGGGHGGTITVNAGTVTSTGGQYAAGLGGGEMGDGGIITIAGGTTSALAGSLGMGSFGAGIGGGDSGNGGIVVIAAGAHVTAQAGLLASAVGGGRLKPFGSLSVEGTLTLNSVMTIPAGVTVPVATTGVITGAGSINGAGTIVNDGAITHTTVGASVSNNNFLVTFDSNGSDTTPTTQAVRVYAPNFSSGARTIPSPVRTDETLKGWNTAADGSGTTFDATTAITDDLTVYAQWAPASVTITPSTTAVTAGETTTLAVEAFDAHGGSLGDHTVQVDFTSDDTSDQVTGNSILFTMAGTRTITATLTADPTITDTATITVAADAANPATITLTLSADTVTVGETITGTVTGADAYGNDLGDLTSDATFTSDHATDEITGNSIRFPSASSHLITATVGSGAGTVSAHQAVAVNSVPQPPISVDNPPTANPPAGSPSPGIPPADGPVVGNSAATPAVAETIAFGGYKETAAPLVAVFLVVLGSGLTLLERRRSTARGSIHRH